jgi:hypothetical protein
MAASKMTTEEIFYEYLTLGLLKVLSNSTLTGVPTKCSRQNPKQKKF